MVNLHQEGTGGGTPWLLEEAWPAQASDRSSERPSWCRYWIGAGLLRSSAGRIERRLVGSQGSDALPARTGLEVRIGRHAIAAEVLPAAHRRHDRLGRKRDAPQRPRHVLPDRHPPLAGSSANRQPRGLRRQRPHRQGRPPIVPLNFDTDGNNWKLTSLRNPVTSVSSNPQELCGVEGNSVDSAWQTTTGRPTTVIAVLDSGIEWCDAGIVDKIALNRNALPPPENAEGQTKARAEGPRPEVPRQRPVRPERHRDPRRQPVRERPTRGCGRGQYAVAGQYGGYFCQDPANQDGSYTGISPEDLIRTFADETLPGGARTRTPSPRRARPASPGAIAGWNFVDNNDDPYDDVHYGHGTGEAEDMAGSADSTSAEVGACPDCMIMPVRVGTSFITTGNAFADGVLFAVDSGATVVSEALGTTDETPTDTEAIEYAAHNQVPIVGSAADEESEHPNLPAAASDDIIDVNSTTEETSWSPPSSLYLNGCTNYGPAIDLTVESASCSSEATGKTSGTVGLIESEAATAVAEGKMAPSGYLSATGQPVPLSANEVKQILTMSADDVNFTTAAPDAKPPAPKDNFTVSNTGIPLGTTTMYPTTKGYDIYTGWGRLDAARAVQWVSEGRVPPQSLIDSPTSLMTFDSQQSVLLTGMVGAPRQGAVRYQVDVGIGAAPADNQWHLVAQGKAPAGGETGALASISMARPRRCSPLPTSPSRADPSRARANRTTTVSRSASGCSSSTRRDS